MTDEESFHPVYRSLNKPLVILGAERRLFFLAMVMAGTTLNFFGSLLAAVLMFSALYAIVRWATVTDEQILRIFLNASRFKLRYDPGRFEPYSVVRIRHDQVQPHH